MQQQSTRTIVPVPGHRWCSPWHLSGAGWHMFRELASSRVSQGKLG